MVTKTLTITQEAYDFLKRQKRGDMSFSEAILSLKGRGGFAQYAGVLKHADLDSIDKAKEESRKRSVERIEEAWR